MRTLIIAAALTFGVWQCADAAYIHVKAILAQYLLEQAWLETKLDGQGRKPWPWADTTPVARLRLARLGVDQIVLSGDSGRVLAFGPGWAESSAEIGASGTAVISGHRDTHFDFLQNLILGDVVELESRERHVSYKVVNTAIVDASEARLFADSELAQLKLVTCYPFHAVAPGGPLRFVVTAVLQKSQDAESSLDR